MIKQLLVTIVVAVLASFATLHFSNRPGVFATEQITQLASQLSVHPEMQARFTAPAIVFSGESPEDAWLEGIGNDGLPRPGPADDFKALVERENSVCFLTEVEFKGMNEPGDQLACRVSVDDFTGFWEIHAVQGDGTDASVRCNAQCLVIE